MQAEELQYDVSIIGGGLAGLATAILLKMAGASVILFEKEKYPVHKVCGEYVSMESWDFLCSLGLPLDKMNLPIIKNLKLTSLNSTSLKTSLPLGGFGISRYLLDSSLMQIAKEKGVAVMDETKVEAVDSNEFFTVYFTSKNNNQSRVTSKVCCAAFGKKSNLDVKWNRLHLTKKNKRLHNYVAVKYHVKTVGDAETISLHNFRNGYCGFSKIEGDIFCLCYMTKASELRKYKNRIKLLEEQVLFRNSHLKKIFKNSTVIDEFPITISGIDFNKKELVENGILMLGDAAGMITPLCGNGMSIALHTAKIATGLIEKHLKGNLTKKKLEKEYIREWEKNFSTRLKIGRIIQRFFGSNILSNLFVSTFKMLPFLARPVIKMTHGKPF